jgi:uncharacterized damage-inducible protein DinB
MESIKKAVTGVYSHYPNDILLKAFKEGPERIRASIAGLTLNELKERPLVNKWSIAETVIHLADAEIFGASRFRLAYCHHPGPLPFYKEAVLAELLKYQERPLEFIDDSLSLFELLRKTTLPLLNNLSEQEWQIKASHPERGDMTIRELLELYADHSERHLEQILVRRGLLGHPITVELILKDRLY